MKTIVIYSSETGFTQRYAQWIAEELNCDAVSWKEISQDKIKEYDRMIYGGSLVAAHIAHWNKVSSFKPNHTIVFAVGMTPESEEYKQEVKKVNELSEIPFYYFRGGVAYEKLGFFKRNLLKKITGLQESEDFSDKESIIPLVEYCQ